MIPQTSPPPSIQQLNLGTYLGKDDILRNDMVVSECGGSEGDGGVMFLQTKIIPFACYWAVLFLFLFV
jgi:hypothetical protein